MLAFRQNRVAVAGVDRRFLVPQYEAGAPCGCRAGLTTAQVTQTKYNNLKHHKRILTVP